MFAANRSDQRRWRKPDLPGLASYALMAEVVICPPFTALGAVAELLAGSVVKLGAQDLFWEEKGAYTGEISPGMLQDVGCDYVIIGHSERRGYFGETDADVNRKVKAALAHGLKPIICLGESLVQREAGQTEKVVTEQVRLAYEGVAPSSAEQTVIAYEPIWAIGTGRNASRGSQSGQRPHQANRRRDLW